MLGLVYTENGKVITPALKQQQARLANKQRRAAYKRRKRIDLLLMIFTRGI